MNSLEILRPEEVMIPRQELPLLFFTLFTSL